MINVYIVSLKTTGETWHTFVCSNMETVEICLRNHGITELHYASADFYEFFSKSDNSQTATVSRVHLLDFLAREPTNAITKL